MPPTPTRKVQCRKLILARTTSFKPVETKTFKPVQPEPEQYWCRKCSTVLKTTDLKNHRCSRRSASSIKFKVMGWSCAKCGLIFNDADTLKGHQTALCKVQCVKQEPTDEGERIPSQEETASVPVGVNCGLIFKDAETLNVQHTAICKVQCVKQEPTNEEASAPSQEETASVPVEKNVRDDLSVGSPLKPIRTYTRAPRATGIVKALKICHQKETNMEQERIKQLPETNDSCEAEASTSNSSNAALAYPRCSNCCAVFRDIQVMMHHQKFVCKTLLLQQEVVNAAKEPSFEQVVSKKLPLEPPEPISIHKASMARKEATDGQNESTSKKCISIQTHVYKNFPSNQKVVKEPYVEKKASKKLPMKPPEPISIQKTKIDKKKAADVSNKCRRCGLIFPNFNVLIEHQRMFCKIQKGPLKTVVIDQRKQQIPTKVDPKLAKELERRKKKKEMDFLATWLKLGEPPKMPVIAVADRKEEKERPTTTNKTKLAYLAKWSERFCEKCRLHFKTKYDLNLHRIYSCQGFKSKRKFLKSATKVPTPDLEPVQVETGAEKPVSRMIKDEWGEDEPPEMEIDEGDEVVYIKDEPIGEVEIKLEPICGVQTSPEHFVAVKAEPEDVYPEISISLQDLKTEVDLEDFAGPTKRQRTK